MKFVLRVVAALLVVLGGVVVLPTAAQASVRVTVSAMSLVQGQTVSLWVRPKPAVSSCAVALVGTAYRNLGRVTLKPGKPALRLGTANLAPGSYRFRVNCGRAGTTKSSTFWIESRQPPQPPTPPLGSASNPIPLGSSATVGEYRMSIVEAIRGAERFLDIWAPEFPGRRFLLVTSRFTRVAAGDGSPFWDLSFRVVGADRNLYQRPLGSRPLSDSILDVELLQGGSAIANDDYALPDPAMRGTLLYRVEDILADDVVYFALPDSSAYDRL